MNIKHITFLEQTFVGDEEEVLVSTVFLNDESNFFDTNGNLILWKTTIVSPKVPSIHLYQRNYTSREKALIGHDKAIMIAEDALLDLSRNSID